MTFIDTSELAGYTTPPPTRIQDAGCGTTRPTRIPDARYRIPDPSIGPALDSRYWMLDIRAMIQISEIR
jgi:hypothetical protein